MIRVERDGEVFEIKDFLVKLYIRNGFRVVTEKPKEEPKVYAHPFDDGSDPEYTRRCLEAQKRRGW